MVELLRRIADKYSHPDYLATDPISIVYRYESPEDREVVGLIASLYSYGKVTSIIAFLNRLLELLGPCPYKTLSHGSFRGRDFEKNLIPYRFQKVEDHIQFLDALSSLLRKRKGRFPVWERDFLGGETPMSHADLQCGLGIVGFQNQLRAELASHSYGLDFLVGKGKKEASHKRYSMFLRWMVGTQFPDFQIYKKYPEEALVFPLDTHIQKIMEILDLKPGKTPSRKVAVSFTNRLTEILGEPSTRYDFALSRLGIREKCKGSFVPDICHSCAIRSICKYYPL